ncbi:MAG: DUF934 domain-containing protein [Alphaproteobacteria bacterium]
MIILDKKVEKKNKFLKIQSECFCVSDVKEYTILNLKQWNLFKNSKKRISNLGIQIFSDENVLPIANDLTFFKLIEINFRSFKDGRPFTLAKELRRKYNYTQEIRASGNILPDQFVFLLRCGFSTVEISKDQKDLWIELLNIDDGLYYQP